MARTERFTRKDILNSGVEFIRNYGIEKMNSREFAKYMGCSTQPIFRNFDSLDDFKKELKVYLHKDYENFINKIVDKKEYLLTISYAYAMYAKCEPNIFRALFITDLAGSRTVDEVINSSWNRETIEMTSKTFNISIKESEDLYRDVRFYTHGISCQLCCGSIKLNEKDLYNLIDNIIKRFGVRK